MLQFLITQTIGIAKKKKNQCNKILKYTVEPHYNDLGTMKFTLLYQGKKTPKKYKELEPANVPLLRWFCYIRTSL